MLYKPRLWVGFECNKIKDIHTNLIRDFHTQLLFIAYFRARA